MMATEEKPITKEDIDKLAAEIEEGRQELNRIGQVCRGYQKDFTHMEGVLQASQALDLKIVEHMKMQS